MSLCVTISTGLSVLSFPLLHVPVQPTKQTYRLRADLRFAFRRRWARVYPPCQPHVAPSERRPHEFLPALSIRIAFMVLDPLPALV